MEPGFKVFGISVRTTNKNEMGENAKLGQLWGRFFSEGIAEKIPDREGCEVFAVYCNYESDFNGEYECLIGVRSNSEDIVEGLKYIEIQPGKYVRLKTEKGPIFEVVSGLWKKVWSMTDKELGGKRSYKTDYEVYSKEASDPNSAVVDLFIGFE